MTLCYTENYHTNLLEVRPLADRLPERRVLDEGVAHLALRDRVVAVAVEAAGDLERRAGREQRRHVGDAELRDRPPLIVAAADGKQAYSFTANTAFSLDLEKTLVAELEAVEAALTLAAAFAFAASSSS